jgi:hypothetical protein
MQRRAAFDSLSMMYLNLALKLFVLILAPGGRRKCGKWLKNGLFGQHCGHSRIVAVAKPLMM